MKALKKLTAIALLICMVITAAGCGEEELDADGSNVNSSDANIVESQNETIAKNMFNPIQTNITPEEKEQLKHFKDGWTIKSDYGKELYVYQYGKLISTVDFSSLSEHELGLFDYEIIGEYAYICLSHFDRNTTEDDAPGLYQLNLKTSELKKIMGIADFEQYTTNFEFSAYKLKMLKHNAEIIFLIPASNGINESWVNIVSINTSEDLKPKFIKKLEGINWKGFDTFRFYTFDVVDENNYRIFDHNCGNGKPKSYNLNMNDYSISDLYTFDEANITYEFVFRCFYRDGKNICFSSANFNSNDPITGKEIVHRVLYKFVQGEGKKEIGRIEYNGKFRFPNEAEEGGNLNSIYNGHYFYNAASDLLYCEDTGEIKLLNTYPPDNTHFVRQMFGVAYDVARSTSENFCDYGYFYKRKDIATGEGYDVYTFDDIMSNSK